MLRKEKAGESYLVTQQAWDGTRTGQEVSYCSLPVSLLFPLFILPDRHFPTLAPAGSDAGQWTGQDPVLVTPRTPLVLLIKKPPRKQVSGCQSRAGVGKGVDKVVWGKFLVCRNYLYPVLMVVFTLLYAFVGLNGTVR